MKTILLYALMIAASPGLWAAGRVDETCQEMDCRSVPRDSLQERRRIRWAKGRRICPIYPPCILASTYHSSEFRFALHYQQGARWVFAVFTKHLSTNTNRAGCVSCSLRIPSSRLRKHIASPGSVCPEIFQHCVFLLCMAPLPLLKVLCERLSTQSTPGKRWIARVRQSGCLVCFAASAFPVLLPLDRETEVGNVSYSLLRVPCYLNFCCFYSIPRFPSDLFCVCAIVALALQEPKGSVRIFTTTYSTRPGCSK